MTDSAKKPDADWESELTPQQFAVCRKKGTERAFTGDYYECTDPGTYRCICCGAALFSSATKYDSGTGWPSFYQPIDDSAVVTEPDTSHGIQRQEVVCSRCQAHLGHVFDDGPEPTGRRYCINSVALSLDRNDSDG